MTEQKVKKDRSIRSLIAIVVVFAVIVIIMIIIPIRQHKQYLRFMGDLSQVTSRTETKNVVYCHYKEDDILLNADQKIDIYRKLVYSELKRRAVPADKVEADGITITYGVLATLTLAPAEYKGADALYVEYHSDNMDYIYLAPHLRFATFEGIVKE